MTGAVGLETAHAPLGDAFPRVSGREEARAFELDADAVARFERDGFLTPLDVLDAEQVADLAARVDAIGEDLDRHRPLLYEVERAYTERPAEVVLHYLGGWRVDERLHDLVFHPAVTVPLAQLLGVDRLRFWHDQVFHKPPRHPAPVPWHQDWAYWTRTTPMRHVTMFVALDDMDLDNGCLHYAPGTHRWRTLPPAPFAGDEAGVTVGFDDAERAAFAPTPSRLRAGQASVHHANTLHGSAGNRSDRPRRALVLNYMAADTRVADDAEPLLAGAPAIAVGEVVEGAFFPVVLDQRRWT